jgi:hypothetical protein
MPNWINPEPYSTFDDEEQAIAFCKSWGLLPVKATKQKTYRYKGQGMDTTCEVIGYANLVFAVIQVGEHIHSIHPSYLREMQTANFGKGKLEEGSESIDSVGGVAPETEAEADLAAIAMEEEVPDPPLGVELEDTVSKKTTKSEVNKEATKPQAAPTVELPEGKVSIEATVAEFAMVPNPFSDNDDEVVIFESVSFINADESVSLESAWSSYSNALKKVDLQVGDQITCEAKLVAKKLSKHPVKYKINNAAKITKTS